MAGAARLEDGDWRIFTEDEGLPHQVVHAAWTDGQGVNWFACRRGLARSRSSPIEVLFPETNFRSIVEQPAGRLWFGTSDGAMEFHNGKWSTHQTGAPVLPMLVASDGSVWAGSISVVLRHDGHEWKRIPLPRSLADAEVHAMAEAPDGSIWVATSKGAGRYRRTTE